MSDEGADEQSESASNSGNTRIVLLAVVAGALFSVTMGQEWYHSVEHSSSMTVVAAGIGAGAGLVVGLVFAAYGGS